MVLLFTRSYLAMALDSACHFGNFSPGYNALVPMQQLHRPHGQVCKRLKPKCTDYPLVNDNNYRQEV